MTKDAKGRATSRAVAGYVRVSTDRQAEEGYGLDVQRDAIRAWAKAHRRRVTLWFSDEGVSGTKDLADRPGLADALDAVRNREVGGIVVARLDRLARDLVLQEQLLAEVRRLGGQVFTASAGEAGYLEDDPDDPSRRLIRQVLGAVAEYERSMIALRLRSGRKRKREQGGFAYGSPRFGTRAEGGELVLDETEAETLARITELHGEGLSTRAIADRLNAEGLQSKRGGEWYSATVARVLRRATPART
jgi:DNA invertase Pin-like site-specific DNA recombinase